MFYAIWAQLSSLESQICWFWSFSFFVFNLQSLSPFHSFLPSAFLSFLVAFSAILGLFAVSLSHPYKLWFHFASSWLHFDITLFAPLFCSWFRSFGGFGLTTSDRPLKFQTFQIWPRRCLRLESSWLPRICEIFLQVLRWAAFSHSKPSLNLHLYFSINLASNYLISTSSSFWSLFVFALFVLFLCVLGFVPP